MCGIGGIVGGARLGERETTARRIQAALRHRGPDDQGVFSTEAATLVHTRLAILDPTPAGRQPMTRGPLTITFNGEIYAFRELRAELARADESFTTGTDTEVVLALFAREGAACLPRLHGMFALAIWDERDRSCFLARDPFGIKPLYYAALPSGELLFASELRALLESDRVPRTIDPQGLSGFLATGSVPEPWTIAAGVHCLEAGTSLRWQAGQTTLRRWFDFDSPVSAATAVPSSEPLDLRAVLAGSVRRHLVSDVPVGLLLSGGLDSGVLLALLRQEGAGEITTFSIGVEDAALDEREAARAMARHFGARHHRLLLTQELARHWIDDFLGALDQPSLDGFNTYCACKLARDHDCRVVLSGLGADELFGGYPSFQHVRRLRATAQALQPLGARPAARALAHLRPSARLARALDYFQGTPSLSRAYDAFRGVFTRAEAGRIRSGLALGSGTDLFPTIEDEESAANLDAISRLELTRYLRNQLLRDADALSMAHGVELRVPLLDLPLFATLRRIDPERRFAANKGLLRETVPELPAAVLDRRKRGFDLPFAAWLRDEWRDLADELPPLPGVALKPWYRQWTLIVLRHWLRRHRFFPA